MTAEQQARDMLERMGVDGAQNFSAGELVELANLIAAAPQWRPIEAAPKDGTTYFLATNGSGVWVAHFQEFAVSGYRFDNPWRSLMMNHWHISDTDRRYGPPTHWMPLPAAPKE